MFVLEFVTYFRLEKTAPPPSEIAVEHPLSSSPISYAAAVTKPVDKQTEEVALNRKTAHRTTKVRLLHNDQRSCDVLSIR